MSKGCDRCGHAKRTHVSTVNGELCVATVGPRHCLCPKYLKPGTMK